MQALPKLPGLSVRTRHLFATELFQYASPREKVFLFLLETHRRIDRTGKTWPDLHVRDFLSHRYRYAPARTVLELKRGLRAGGLQFERTGPGRCRYKFPEVPDNFMPMTFTDSMFKTHPKTCKRLQGIKSHEYELPTGPRDVPFLSGPELRTVELLRVADNATEQLVLLLFQYFHYRENSQGWGLGNVWLFDSGKVGELLGMSSHSLAKAVRSLCADGRMVRVYQRPTVVAMTAFGLATTSARLKPGSLTAEVRQNLPAKTCNRTNLKPIHIRREPEQ